MAADKCKNCGKEIPDDATFCPECGASKTVEEKSHQPQSKTTHPTQHQKAKQMTSSGLSTQAQLSSLAETIFSKYIIMLGICIGILLAWIGVILRNFAGNAGANINGILSPTAFAGIGLLVFGGGFLNKGIDKYVRMGMVIIGGFIIVFGIAGLTLGVNIPFQI